MITVTFLGVGAALPAPGQTNCAYLIEGGGISMLFDCGPAILQQLAQIGRTPGDITHLFVSHAHGDHSLGWPMFLLWWSLEGRDGSRKPPVVLAGKTTWFNLRALWQHCYSELPAPPFTAIELHDDITSVEPLGPKASITAWPMMHSTTFPVLGARLTIAGRVLALTADTARCDVILTLARDADLLIHDARYSATMSPERTEQSKYHCSAMDAGEYAQAAGVKNLALVHIGAEYAGQEDRFVAEAKTKFAGQVFAPKAGETFRV